MSWYTILWLVLLVVFIIAEFATLGFVSVWFAAGSLVALIASIFTPSFAVQLLVFVIASAVALGLFMNPIRRRFQKRAVPTNADNNIGRVAVCITKATASSLARVRLDGVDWNARSENALEVGSECRILSITGATLNVELISHVTI